jgi:hypothetical protein
MGPQAADIALSRCSADGIYNPQWRLFRCLAVGLALGAARRRSQSIRRLVAGRRSQAEANLRRLLRLSCRGAQAVCGGARDSGAGRGSHDGRRSRRGAARAARAGTTDSYLEGAGAGGVGSCDTAEVAAARVIDIFPWRAGAGDPAQVSGLNIFANREQRIQGYPLATRRAVGYPGLRMPVPPALA